MIPAYVWVFVHIGLASWGVYHTLLYKRDPRAAMGWIMACVFVPFGGPIAYFLFGINRVRARARGIKRRFFSVAYEIGEKKSPSESGRVLGIRAIGHRITGRAATPGNVVTPLLNGDVAYPVMLKSIAEATDRILLASYIMNVDAVGKQFAKALGVAVDRGVEVKVLIDGFGQYYSRGSIVRLLEKHNVAVQCFLPPRLFPPSIYLNLRNHRKLLIIDDQVAYAGGMNISAAHVADLGKERLVSDLHFQLEGPVAHELSQLFCHDWQFATGSTLRPPMPVREAGKDGVFCRVIPDSPDEDLDALALTIETVVSAAAQTVDIMTPYFLPTREIIASIQAAALRGVRVRVILPQKNNLFFVHWAGRNKLAELLQSDIEVYYQPAPFCHAKLLCVDDSYSLIGSANIDPRSLRLNFELGVEVFSEQLNTDLKTYFEKVLSSSTQLHYKTLLERSVPERLRDSAAALFSPYL